MTQFQTSNELKNELERQLKGKHDSFVGSEQMIANAVKNLIRHEFRTYPFNQPLSAATLQYEEKKD